MTDLAEACAAIAALIPEARHLITQPDEDGTTGTGQPGTRPPWNQAAANAYTDPLEGIPRLAASMHRDVHGNLGPRLSLDRAITAITSYETAVTITDANRAARILGRWARAIEQLPAIDTAEPWRRISGYPCPYCKHAMVYLRPRAGEITCLRYGACHDNDGHHPAGHIEQSRFTGDPCIRWNDGLVT